MRYILIGASLLSLAACATPRQQCEYEATKQHQALLRVIAQTEGNIARGYAIHRQSVPYTYTKTCYSGAISYACPATGYRTQETPVSINISEERRLLRAAVSKAKASEKNAMVALKQCANQFPE
jgi:hypothetical protein